MISVDPGGDSSLVNQTAPTAAFSSFRILNELNAAVGVVWFTRLG